MPFTTLLSVTNRFLVVINSCHFDSRHVRDLSCFCDCNRQSACTLHGVSSNHSLMTFSRNLRWPRDKNRLITIFFPNIETKIKHYATGMELGMPASTGISYAAGKLFSCFFVHATVIQTGAVAATSFANTKKDNSFPRA